MARWIERYYAAACQIDLPNPPHRDEIAGRVERMLEMIDCAVVGYEPFFDVRLVVFPEFAHAAPIYPTAEELLERLAVPIPNEHTDRYAEKARQLGVYIQTGTFLESDLRWPGHVFNTTCLIGPDGIAGQVSQGPSVDAVGSPHQPARPGRLRRAAVSRWPKPRSAGWARRSATTGSFPRRSGNWRLAGAEVLIRVSAYMDPWGTAAPLDWWTLINRVRAIENMAYVVAANQAASLQQLPAVQLARRQHDRRLRRPHAGPGRARGRASGSSSGRSIWPPCAPSASAAAATTCSPTCAPRPIPAYRQPIYPAGQAAGGPISLELNEESIRRGREAVRRVQDGRP